MSPQIHSPSLRLPDFLASWPYERRLNPHCAKVSKAAYTWISSYGLLTPKLQRAFELGNSGLLAALAYPEASKAHLRAVCDALNIVLLFDDYSDTQSPQVVRIVADNIIDALYNPYAPPVEHDRDLGRFGEITRSFWTRALQTLSPSCARRFTAAFCDYSESIVQQARDRSKEHVRDVDSYLILRRDTIGAKLAFALLECDDDVLNDPSIVELENAAIDIISLSNDAYSFDIEQSRDDEAHNMLTCMMRAEGNLSLQDAMSLVHTHILALEQRFLAIRAQVCAQQQCHLQQRQPWAQDEPVDSSLALAALLAYIDGIGNWVRANDAWSFESQRYFGPRGLEIQAGRTLELRPKRIAAK